MKKYLKKIRTIFLRIVATFLVLFLLLVLVIQIPSVQNLIKNQAVTYLEGKIKTKIKIEKLEIAFPQKVILAGVYFEDQKKDTLLSGEKIIADISVLQIINNKIQVNAIELEGITTHLNKNKKGIYNFDYIIKAFATPDKPIEEDTTPMQFSLDEINLNRIRIKYSDASSKNNTSIELKHLNTHIKTFDLEGMNFEIPKVTVNGLQLKLKQELVKTTNIAKETSGQTKLKLNIGEIDLKKFAVDYDNENDKLKTTVSFKKLFVKFNKIDLNKQFILVESIDLSNAKGILALAKKDKIIPKKVAIANETSDWEIKISKTNFDKINFRYDNNDVVAVKKGIDYNHLNLSNLNLNIENINYNPENISGNINSLTVKEQSGLAIESLKTDFFYGKKNAYLKNLYLKTPQTLLKDELVIGYPNIESITENLGELSIKASLKDSKLGFKDILLFVPKLSETNPFKNNPNAILRINSSVSGKLKNIEIPNLEISGIGTTKIAASGRIVGLPDMKKANFDIVIKDFKSSSKDLNQFVPKGTIPNSIAVPAQFGAKGIFKGTIANFNTKMNVQSSFGNAKIKATFDQRIKNKEQYNAETELENFDLGKFIKNDSVGKITAKATVKGTGFNPKTANAVGSGTILKVNFNKYTYQNLVIKGKINNGSFNVTAQAKDPNLTFDLISSGGFKDKYPTGKLKLNVDIADLEKLNLHAGPLKLRGVVEADIQSVDLDYLNGKMTAHTLFVTNEKGEFAVDSITIAASTTSEKSALALESPFLDATLNGKYKLSQLPTALSNSISKYYNWNPTSKKGKATNNYFDFKLNVKDNPVVTQLIPDLKSLAPILITGRYNAENDSIVLNGAIPKLIYGDNTVTNAIFTVDTQDKALVYNLIVDDIQNTQIQLPYTSISGKVQNNTVEYALQLKDLKDKERYFIAGTMNAANGNSEINLDSEKLMLNYESWNISPENLIRFGKKGIYASDFELKKEENSIKIQSQSEKPNAPIVVDFKNFEIETITSMVEKSDLKMSGKINGTALLKNVDKNLLFTSDLLIEDFTFKKDTVGTIAVKVNNEIANQYDAHITLTGQENQVNLDGVYRSNDGSFDMKLLIDRLNMKSIQGFSMNHLTESTGFFTGNFTLRGTTKQPELIGTLKFNEISFKATELNARFQSMNDSIAFTTNAVLFDNFIIKDEKGNDLSINGKIDSHNFSNFGFDLAIDAENFKAINSKAKDNDLFYGELYLDNHLKIKGTLNNPIVEGNIKVNKDTKFTVVLPQSDPSIAEREGIVEFIDQDHPQIVATVKAEEILNQSEIKGVNASVNIEIDKEAEFSIIIDKSNGDYLKLKGEANLYGGIDASGKTTLTGKYEFTEGTYEMTFSALKRKFDIKKGSYILWNGEPTTADVNITAVYKINTAPLDLLSGQLGAVSEEIRNTYKEKVAFETLLIMKGELMKPDITFDIILPEGINSVSPDVLSTTQTKLTQLRQDPSELNKQVFALLLLNHFIGENPFSSESGSGSVSSLARVSASKILSEQLNNLAGDLIKGIDIDFNLQSTEDYTSGQRQDKTDLNIGISKKLLNDRLKVTVGSSFGLEGTQQANQQSNNIAGDVSIDYQLSKDGRYKIRGYRINKYQVALQGEVVETGISFIITLDYNKFKELFQKSKVKTVTAKKEKTLKKKSDE
nr:translocation/assembly module TamB domain-containing protein [uncultured Flavobacterium sp.]